MAIFSGDAGLDRIVTEVMSDLEVEVDATIAAADAAQAAQEAAEEELLWIVDAAAADLDAAAFLQARRGPVILLGAERVSETLLDAADYYLARPFQALTLLALCERILGDIEDESAPLSAREAGERPHVVPRAPSLFKSRALYSEACRYVEGVLNAVRAERKPDIRACRIQAERIHTSLLQSNRLLLMALEPYERFELAAHCVNVSLLTGKVAMGLGWRLERVLQAIEAGLVHDIGMARLPERLLLKEGKLTEEEWALVHQHPTLGAAIVERMGEEYEWLRRAVVQEHERMNGQGYPAGLSGAEIDEIARIIAVADVFEAFSHPRTYRSLFTSYEALEQVVGLREESLSGEVVAALVDEISAFPLDSFVLLSTGEIGRVVSTNPTNLMRPTVETVWDPLWRPVEQPRLLDLSADTSVSVTRPLHETELPIT